MPDLKNKFLYQAALAVSQLLFPLITYPWLTRTLGPEGLGKTGYIEFTAGLIITVFTIGISYYGVREVAKLRNNPAERSQLISQLLSLHLVSMLAGILVFLIILFFNSNFRNENELILMGSVYILAQVFALEWYLQGMEKFRFITIRSIVIRIAGLLCILLFVKTKEDYVLYFGIITLTQLVISITALAHVIKENKQFHLTTSFLHHAKPLSLFLLTTTFISIYVYFDTIILGFLTDVKTVGYYTIAIKVVKLPLLLLLTFNTILFPRISFLNAEKNTTEVQRYFKITLDFVFTFTIPICTAIFFLAPEIVQVLAGTGFEHSVAVLQLLSGLPFLICISNFLVLQVLIPGHLENKLVIAVLAGCICSLVLLLAFIPGLKEQGAALATLLTEFLVMILCLYFSWTTIRKSIPIKSFLSSLVFSVLVIPIVCLAREITDNPLLILLIAGTGIALIYTLLQYFVAGSAIISESIQFLKTLFTKTGK